MIHSQTNGTRFLTKITLALASLYVLGCSPSAGVSQSVHPDNLYDSGKHYFFTMNRVTDPDSTATLLKKSEQYFYQFLDTSHPSELDNKKREAIVWLTDIYGSERYHSTKQLFKYVAKNYPEDITLKTWLTDRLDSNKNYRTKNFIRANAAELKEILDVRDVLPSYAALSGLLEKAFDDDQKIRKQLLELRSNGMPEPQREQSLMDSDIVIQKRNTAIVDSILKNAGWPSPGQVGIKASRAIFYVIHHADDVTFFKYYPEIMNAYKTGKILTVDYQVYLDRCLVKKYGYQIYGTQSYYDSSLKKTVLFPVKDSSIAF